MLHIPFPLNFFVTLSVSDLSQDTSQPLNYRHPRLRSKATQFLVAMGMPAPIALQLRRCRSEMYPQWRSRPLNQGTNYDWFLQPHEEDSQLADLSAQYTAFKAQWFAALCSPSLFAMASHEEVAKPKCEVGQVVVPRSFTMSLFEWTMVYLSLWFNADIPHHSSPNLVI